MSVSASASPLTTWLKRGWPLLAIIVAATAFFSLGLHRLISFDLLATNYGQLADFIEQNPILAYGAAGLLYVAAVAIAFPAAWLITVSCGLLFGWFAGSVLVIVSATIGACILYFVARNLAADFFRDKAGDRLNVMAKGFRENAVSYMLFLRLAPIFPFLLVNVVPAILGVRFSTFAWTTALGIIPGSIAYVYAGEGLRSVIAQRAEACAIDQPPCGTPLSPSDLVTPQIIIAIALLALVSLLPALLKRIRKFRSDAPKSE